MFGGRDVYALVAQWNAPDRCKDKMVIGCQTMTVEI